MATLYRLNRPGTTPATADIVFIHGLNPWVGEAKEQHPFTTWRGTDALHPGWPADLATALPDTQVWVLEYDASALRWAGDSLPLPRLAKEVLAAFYGKRLGERPLIFLAHSLGGLVVKQVLRHAKDEKFADWVPIWEQTRGVIFFGTPHAGADLAKLVQAVALAARPGANISDLYPHNANLEDLAEFYRTHAPRKGIRTYAFGEDRPTKGFMVVDTTSANPAMDNVPFQVVAVDHFELAQLKDCEENLAVVVRFIEDTLHASEGEIGTPGLIKVPFAELSAAEQRKYVQDYLSRDDLAVIWSDILEERMDDVVPRQPKDNCFVELRLRCKGKNKLDALYEAIENFN